MASSDFAVRIARTAYERYDRGDDVSWDGLGGGEQAGRAALAAAYADVILGLVAEEVEALRWPRPNEPNSRITNDVHGWRAYRSHEKAIDAALATITRNA